MKYWPAACGVALLWVSCVVAKDLISPAQAKKAAAPAQVAAPDDPKLPRVLLLGDAVSIGYTLPLRLQLKGKFNVHRPAANCGSTRGGLRDLDTWLGKEKWDVIHFNFGLHDMAFLWPDGKNLNAEGIFATRENGGKQNVPLAEYEKNLRTLVARLKRTSAHLIWASTTPVPGGVRSYTEGEELPYNEAAARVMKDEGVQVDDLWGFASRQLDKIQTTNSIHFTPQGYRVLAWHIGQSIESAQVAKPGKTQP